LESDDPPAFKYLIIDYSFVFFSRLR